MSTKENCTKKKFCSLCLSCYYTSSPLEGPLTTGWTDPDYELKVHELSDTMRVIIPSLSSHPSLSGLKKVCVRSFPSSSGILKGSFLMLSYRFYRWTGGRAELLGCINTGGYYMGVMFEKNRKAETVFALKIILVTVEFGKILFWKAWIHEQTLLQLFYSYIERDVIWAVCVGLIETLSCFRTVNSSHPEQLLRQVSSIVDASVHRRESLNRRFVLHVGVV